MNREIREIIIGAVTIALLVCVIIILNLRDQIVDVATSEGLAVAARFNKVDGLVEGSEVRLGGIKVGYVSRMELDDQFRAEVILKLNDSLPLPKDSSASIHTDGLFGYKFVVLEPGAESDYIESGGELNFTQDAVVVGDLLELIISEGRASRGEGANAAK